jgi:hypothetical protein
MSDLEQPENSDNDPREGRGGEFIASGGRIVGGTAGAAVGRIGGPIAALAGGAAGVAVGDVLANAAVEFYDRHLARRQSVRAAGALAVATVEIQERLEAGDAPRGDFLDDTSDESDASEILEGTLLAAANSYEQRKIRYLGKFYANLSFSPSVTPSYANLLLKLIDRLTYGQLRVMAMLGRQDYLNRLIQVGAERQEGQFRSAPDVIAEMDELSTMGMMGVKQQDDSVVAPTSTMGSGSWAHIDLFRARLTPTGQLLHDLLGLSDMADGERDAVIAGLQGAASLD